MTDWPIILETDVAAERQGPQEVRAMLIEHIAMLEANGTPRERAFVARWRQLQEAIADYRLRYPIEPRATVGFRFDLAPLGRYSRMTGCDRSSSVHSSRRTS